MATYGSPLSPTTTASFISLFANRTACLQFDVTGLSAYTVYGFRVRASSSSGQSGFSPELQVVTPSAPPAMTALAVPLLIVLLCVLGRWIDLGDVYQMHTIIRNYFCL